MTPIPHTWRGKTHVSLGRWSGTVNKVPDAAILAVETYFNLVKKCGTPPYTHNNKWNGNENTLEALNIASNIRIQTLESEVDQLKTKIADPSYEFYDDENIDKSAARSKMYQIATYGGLH
jgi:hypothetical protein